MQRPWRPNGGCLRDDDYEQVLADDDVDLVLIATRHDLHGRDDAARARCRQNVFVEKPLALTETELDRIEASTRRAMVHC